jgi:hypothetical protein
MADDQPVINCEYFLVCIFVYLIILSYSHHANYCQQGNEDRTESKISLLHPDDIDWFITLDETYHKLTTPGNKGGSTTI